MSTLQDTDHPILVLIRGVPGSGKSYLATALETSLGETRVLILDPDKVDLTSAEYLAFSERKTQEGIDLKFHPYRWSREQAYEAIKANKVIIWNQPFTNLDGFNKTVINLEAYAKEHGTTLPLLVVEVEIHHDVAKARVTERKQQGGHGPTEGTFARFASDYRSFADEGYNTVTVYGEDDIQKSVAAVTDGLKKLAA